MGMKLFTKDGIFWPAENGVYTGDTVNVVLVAGGNGGKANVAKDLIGLGGYLGEDSSFGTYAVAKAGAGAKGAVASYNSSSAGGGDGGGAGGGDGGGAGGGGGFIPGAAVQGGNGIAPKGAAVTHIGAPQGNGGGASSPSVRIFGGNGAHSGGGIGGNPLADYCGEGGAGFGAGGGAVMPGNTAAASFGGDAGQIRYYSHIITDRDVTNGIPITVGAGYGSLQAYTGTPTTTTNSARAVRPIIPGLNYGSFGIYLTFTCANGTYGIAPAHYTDSRPLSTNQVKFRGVDKITSFASAFPNFSASYTSPIYSCNGYYLQITNTPRTTVRWVEIEAAHVAAAAGTVTPSGKYGSIDLYNGSSIPGIYDNTDIVVMTSSTQILIYKDWTPSKGASAYTTVPLSASVTPAPDSSYRALIQYDSNMCPMLLADSTTGSFSHQIFTKTGSTSTMSYSDCMLYPVARRQAVMSTHRYSSIYSYGVRDLTTSATSTYGPTYIYVPTNTAGHTVSCRSSSTYGYNLAILTEDCIGSLSSDYNIQPITSNYIAYGYDGNPGTPGTASGNGGGAGGCCMISW